MHTPAEEDTQNSEMGVEGGEHVQCYSMQILAGSARMRLSRAVSCWTLAVAAAARFH